jgi:hypothetical protein
MIVLGAQLQLAHNRADRVACAADRDFRHIAGSHDRKPVEGREHDVDCIGRAGAGAHRQHQLLTDAQTRAIDTCRDLGALEHGKRGDDRNDHQSFTPAAAARRVRPVRSRRVRSSS